MSTSRAGRGRLAQVPAELEHGIMCLRERTWVLLTESPEGGWGIAVTRTRTPTSPRPPVPHSQVGERRQSPAFTSVV